MNIPLKRPPRGAILVFALMCSAVAVIGMTYWIATVAARGQYVELLTESGKRRLARENGRAISTRHVRARVLGAEAGVAASRGLGTYYSGTDNYDWGGADLTSSWSGSSLSSLTSSIGINRISYGDITGFGLRMPDGTALDLPFSVLDGRHRWSYRWQARSYSPVLSGDLLVVHRPPTGSPDVAISGGIAVHGRAFFWVDGSNPSVDATVACESYATSGPAIATLAAAGVPLSNYPPVWNLTWTSTSATGDAGFSNVVWDANSPGNSLRNKALDSKTLPALHLVDGGVASTSSNGYSSDGTGTVSVDLSNPTLDVVVVENAATLQLRGQSTATAWADVATYPSVLVVYHQAAGSTHSLSAIQCLDKNNRRVVLGVKKDPNQTAVARDLSRCRHQQGGSRSGVAPHRPLRKHSG